LVAVKYRDTAPLNNPEWLEIQSHEHRVTLFFGKFIYGLTQCG